MTNTDIIEYENLGKLNASFLPAYIKACEEVLEKGWFILGERVKQFENEFATYTNASHCVGLANGLDALILALRSYEFPKGSEVIVPSNTYIATVLSILHNGLTPVLVEPDINTYNIDPSKIEEKISKNTKAIIVVHLYGKMCEMDKIIPLAKKYDIRVIEDCAQSHGAKYKNIDAGGYGDIGAWSFYPTKNLGAIGDAGAITTNDENTATTIRGLRNYGSSVKYYNERIGFNSRLDELQAAFLSIKLKKLDDIARHKRKLASLYHSGLKNDLIKPVVHDDYFDVYHIYNVRHPKRDQLKEYLMQKGIRTEIHYPVAPNKQLAMKGILDQTETPIAEEIHQTTLSLPISYYHTEQDIHRVIEVINKF